ncbi:hypothetical protein GX618_00015, partial [Candidatus Dojkabacteria bacterium]|nr:hypothetical protein [Candidatus Dojkabacteria bacterium]
MIDIKRIVESTKEVENALSKRMKVEEMHLDEIVTLYSQKKEVLKEYESKRAQQNSFNNQMAKADKGSDEFNRLITDLKQLSASVKELEEKVNEYDTKLNS